MHSALSRGPLLGGQLPVSGSLKGAIKEPFGGGLVARQGLLKKEYWTVKQTVWPWYISLPWLRRKCTRSP